MNIAITAVCIRLHVFQHIDLERAYLLTKNLTCSWDYDSFAQPDIGPEDEEAYAKKMWEDMQKRSHSQKRAGGATADTWAKADSAQERRRKAATDAAEHSRRILEEEQAKDRAWRQAVLEVCTIFGLVHSCITRGGIFGKEMQRHAMHG